MKDNINIAFNLRFLKEKHLTNFYNEQLKKIDYSIYKVFKELKDSKQTSYNEDILFNMNNNIHNQFLFNLIPKYRKYIREIDDFKDKINYFKHLKNKAKLIDIFLKKYPSLEKGFKAFIPFDNHTDLANNLFELDYDTKIINLHSLINEYYEFTKEKYKDDLEIYYYICYYYFIALNKENFKTLNIKE